MNASSTITRSYLQVKDSLQEIHRASAIFTETNFEDDLDNVQFISHLFPAYTVLLCNMHHPYPTIPFASPNCQQLLGYTPQEMKRMSMYDLLQLVHPDDLAGLKGGFGFMDDFLQGQPHYAPQEYRFVFYYRIQSKTKAYLSLTDEKIAFQNRKGNYVYFSLLKNLTQKLVQVKVEALKFQPDGFQKIQEYIARPSEREITPRELEILQLIKKGLTTKQIAETLFISIHTVRNHRHRLFEKSKAKNVVDLLNYAQSTQWI